MVSGRGRRLYRAALRSAFSPRLVWPPDSHQSQGQSEMERLWESHGCGFKFHLDHSLAV